MEEKSGSSPWMVRIVNAGTIASPIVGYKFRSLGVVWPPIGHSVEFFAAAIATAIIALVGQVAKRSFKTKARAIRTASLSLVLLLLTFFCYGYLVLKYVKSVTNPVTGEVVHLTVGSQRTNGVARLQALGKLPNPVTDEEILKTVGIEDEDITSMWIPSSVLLVRSVLLISYILILSSINFVAGALARAGD